MIELVQKYLGANNYQGQQQAFEDLFLSHPDYPSVFAITDTLDGLSIENTAIKLPKEQLDQLPQSFLAIYEEDLVLVSKTAASIAIEREKGKKHILSAAAFVKDWTGVIIAIEPNISLVKEKKPSDVKWMQYSLPVILLLIVSFLFNQYNVSSLVLLLTSFAGILVSIFIFQEKLGVKNELVTRYCNINPGTSCNAVIQSGRAAVNKWVSFSDLPLLFFCVNALALLLQPTYSGKITGLLSTAALPVIGYALWVQKFRVKKWCMLCLLVSALILLQAVVFVFTELPLHGFASPDLFYYSVTMIFIVAAWLAIRPVIENNIKMEADTRRLTKFKRNYALYKYLSKQIPFAQGFDTLRGLCFGNKKAGVTLTIIVSPSCGFCHDAVEAAFALVKQYPGKICLNVLFNINPENSDNPFKIVAERLLTISQADPLLANEALWDWHIKKTGLAAWTAKWQTGTESMYAKDQLQQQYDCCMTNGFNYSPVKIVNNKLMPDEYDISELKYFLNDLQRDKAAAGKSILAYM
jgi:uncharacterized membrane protein